MKILIADDDHDNAVSLATLLKVLGHVTHYCLQGVEVMHCVEEVQPDVLFLDLAMPKMTGFDVLQELEACPELRPKKVFVLTGLCEEQIKTRVLKAGCDEFLVKPASIETLRRVLSGPRADSSRSFE